MTETAPPVSSHLKDYLDYYRTLEHPEYAVLVTGEWGTGKTFQVRQAIPPQDAYYVSLFGLSSADDIVAAVYSAMFPTKALIKKGADKIGDITAEVSGIGSLALGGITSALAGALLRQEVKSDKPIVFDDLERCSLDTKELLGVINLYVEHHKCRVIVIAHDKGLTEYFAAAKEKLFGHSIRVEPQTLLAFDRFHSELDDGMAKAFLLKQRDNIIGVFQESNTASLRILRHVIQDLARLVALLRDEHRSHDEAMSELVRLFCAIDIEWRSNRLKAEDLKKRYESDIVYKMNRDKEGQKVPGISTSNARYSSVDLTSKLLSDNALTEMLVEGHFSDSTIRESLDTSSYFVKPQASPPWLIVASFDKLDDEDVNIGLSRMQSQFDNREVIDSGEMLHIFALRMMMASRGVLGKDVNAAAQECITYIDDLLASGKLPPREVDWRWYESFEMSAYGFQYWVTDDYKEKFREVYEHLIEAREASFSAELPSIAPQLLKTMEHDGLTFYRQICHTNVGSSEYAEIPILKAIDPADFVSAWMRSPKSNWHWIKSALQDRYSGNKLNGSLNSEAPWIEQVTKLLNAEAEKTTGLSKVRILRTIPTIAK